jgi:hypothetical protein
MTITLRQQLQAELNIPDADLSRSASDLLVVDEDGKVFKWLQKNYQFPNNVTRFTGIGPWKGKACLTVPFAAWAEWEAAKKALHYSIKK